MTLLEGLICLSCNLLPLPVYVQETCVYNQLVSSSILSIRLAGLVILGCLGLGQQAHAISTAATVVYKHDSTLRNQRPWQYTTQMAA
jgi:hypothetical protein